jgi:holliday junction DNA helicase RuvA
MIGRIAGRLLAKQPPQITVDVSGIGYELDVPMSTLYQLPATGAEVTLYTQLIVREDAHLLYGFATEAERALFRQLIKISGVGARTALSVLSGMSVAELHEAVRAQDGARLTKIPGIGKKTAERLLLELRDRLGPRAGEQAAGTAGAPGTGDVANALSALGYNDKEVTWAVAQLPAGASVTEGIRQALKLLSKKS